MKSPLVSVIMPVYNSERYLKEAIESILNQTFQDFEFLIFDDGSTDNSKEIIKEYVDKDDRIVPFFSEINCGYVVHLNKGIELAKGEFIARMDSDDISLPTRFEKQIDFLKKNPHIGVLGSSTILINEDGKEIGAFKKETDYQLLHFLSYFMNPISHPTVMFRKEIVFYLKGYRLEYMPAEDYNLWVRALKHTKVASLKESLLTYRVHSKSISKARSHKQKKLFYLSQRTHLKNLTGIIYPSHVLSFLNKFDDRGNCDLTESQIEDIFEGLLDIYKCFIRKEELKNKERRFVLELLFNKMYSLSSFAFKESKILGIKLFVSSVIFSFRSFVKKVLLN